ncbi:MAG: hypothetical protein QMC90_01990 [Dehalococcoidales bacterium]|nr:hypothetical protein [Dehalococcoidales bacterium]
MPLEDREIVITFKRVKGRWRKSFPVSMELEEAVEIGYKMLYWISASDVSEQKGLKTAELIVGKI